MSLMRSLAVLLGLLAGTAAAGPFQHNEEPTLLPAEAAFRLLPVTRDGQLLRVEWAISPGYYLYRDQLQFDVLAPQGFRLAPPTLPKADRTHDAERGAVEVFRGLLDAQFVLPPGLKGPLKLRVHYQGCAEVGVCYPPQTQVLTVPALRS